MRRLAIRGYFRAQDKETVMNNEQFKASWEVGPLPEHLQKRWEKITDADLVHIDGDLDTFNGAIAKRYEEMKDEVRRWADLWYARWIGSYIDYYAEWKPAVGSRF
jgi:uncharacterized protein YjbJ (UPF0337 family)